MALSVFNLFKKFVPNSTVRLFLPGTTTTTTTKISNFPTVLILGWGGAKSSSLNKQCNYYTSKGFATVVHIMPLGVLGFIRTFYEQEIMDNIRILNSNENDSKFQSISLVHCYSNNGIWTLAGLCRNYGLRPQKMIFDSTPGLYFECQSKLYFMKLCGVFTSSILAKDTYWHPLLSPVILMILYPLIQLGNIIVFMQKFVGFNLVSDIVDLNVYLRDHPKDIMNDDCRNLFVYSSGDKLLPSWLIEEYIQNVKDKGVRNVNVKIFGEDVPHTSSFYKHPEEYKKEIELLLQSTPPCNTHKNEEKARDNKKQN